MTSFKDREQAFENKFAHDEDLRFRAKARRNRLVGLWAAERLGKTGDAAQAYALEVVAADFEEPGPEDVIRKLMRDLEGKATEAEIRAKMTEMLTRAQQEIQGETG